MNQEMISFQIEDAVELARTYFIQSCRFDLSKREHIRLMQAAENILREGMKEIQIRALVSEISELPKDTLEDDVIILDGISFQCNAFSQLQIGSIAGIYPYILTIGEIKTKSKSASDQLFADIWGTSFIDAARDLLQKWIEKHLREKHNQNSAVVSSSFGPGFYGMTVTAVSDFFQLLDGRKIGVELTESGILLPVKSCTGFYIAAHHEWALPPGDCLSCLGNAGGCDFCKNNPKRNCAME